MNEWVFGSKGVITSRRGDVIMVGRCRKIEGYKIFWEQLYNGSCYLTWPIVTKGGKVKFLDLASRRVFQSGIRMDCSKRKNDTFIRDKDGIFWHYRLSMGFKKVKVHVRHYSTSKLTIPKLGGFEEDLIHFDGATPHSALLLEEASIRSEVWEEISQIRDAGKGNFVSGVVDGIEDLIGVSITAGEEVINTIVDDTGDFLNGTTSVLKKVTRGVFNLFGGVPNFLVFVAEVGIIMYLALRCRLNREKRAYSLPEDRAIRSKVVSDMKFKEVGSPAWRFYRTSLGTKRALNAGNRTRSVSF